MLVQDWLLDANRCTTLLKMLLDEKTWTELDQPSLSRDPFLVHFENTRWCQSRRTGLEHPLATLTLYLSYQWAVLFGQAQTTRPRQQLQLLLFFARFIWPAYRIWVLTEPPATPTHREAADWLCAAGQADTALDELGQPRLEAVFTGYARIRLQSIDSATLSRWIAAGARHYHRHLSNLVDLSRPVDPSRPTGTTIQEQADWSAWNLHWERYIRTRQPSIADPIKRQSQVQHQQSSNENGWNSLYYVLRALGEAKIIAIVDPWGTGKTDLLLSTWRVLAGETPHPIFFLDPTIAHERHSVQALADHWLSQPPAGYAVDPTLLISDTRLGSSHLLIDNFDAFSPTAKAVWLSHFSRVRHVILTCRGLDPLLNQLELQTIYLNGTTQPGRA